MAIWGVNQRIDDLSLSISLCKPEFEKNKSFIAKEGETERKRVREHSYAFPSISLLHGGHMVRSEPGLSKEPRTPSWAPTWVAGPQILGLSSTAFTGKIGGSWIGNWVAGTHISTLIWDADNYSAVLAPGSYTVIDLSCILCELYINKAVSKIISP